MVYFNYILDCFITDEIKDHYLRLIIIHLFTFEFSPYFVLILVFNNRKKIKPELLNFYMGYRPLLYLCLQIKFFLNAAFLKAFTYVNSLKLSITLK